MNPRIALLAILLAAFAVYAPSLGNGFAGDDYIAQPVRPDGVVNPMIATLHGPQVYFSSHYWAGLSGTSPLYRPLTIWGYALTYAVFGPAAWPHHLLNVLLHSAASALVWRLLRGVGLSAGASFAGALVFALHAIHSEVVAGVVGRAEILSFVLGTAGLLCFCRAYDARRGSPLALAAVALFCAYSSKESALGWVAFGPVYVWVRARAGAGAPCEPRRLALAWSLAALLPAVAFALLRARMLALLPDETPIISFVANPLYDADVGTRLLTATMLLGYALWKTLAPFWLCSDYGASVFALATSPADARFLAAAAVILAALAGGVLAMRTRPALALAAAAFFLFAFLTSNLPLAIGTIFGERLYYAPSLALSVLVAALLPRAGRAGVIALGVWLAASCVVVLVRNPAWRDTQTLITTDVARQPRSVRLHVAAAELAFAAHDVAAAEAHLAAAEQVLPDEAQIHRLYAKIALDAERWQDGERHVRRALACAHYEPLAYGHELHLWLASALDNQGQREKALAELQKALAIRPGYAEALRWLLVLSRDRLEPAALLEIVARGASAAPDDAFWAVSRGDVLLRASRAADAEACYRAVLRALPQHGDAALGLGRALAAQGRRDDAVAVFKALADGAVFAPEVRAQARDALQTLPPAPGR